MKNKVLELIDRYETIIIHRHMRPDPDAYGSQGGLAEIIQATYPQKHVFTVGEPEPMLNYLRILDSISDETYKGALVIVCDTANKERICDQRYVLGETIVKIDHHPNENLYGDVLWVDTSASSTCELIYELYLAGKNHGLKMTAKAARLLYAGIVGDTGRFLFPNTSQKTFCYASELIRYDFDRTALYDKQYELDAKVIKLQGYLLQHFEMDKKGIASVCLSKDLLVEYGVNVSEASLLVNSLGNVKGIKAWCFFIEEADQIRVRIRSKGPIINQVAQKFNGGGHPLAAGASIYSWGDVQEVLNELRDACGQP